VRAGRAPVYGLRVPSRNSSHTSCSALARAGRASGSRLYRLQPSSLRACARARYASAPRARTRAAALRRCRCFYSRAVPGMHARVTS